MPVIISGVKWKEEWSSWRASRIDAAPMTAKSARILAAWLRTRSLNRMNPAASPAKANAAQGNSGNNQGCGDLRLWHPSMYDSSDQGSQVGRHVV